MKDRVILMFEVDSNLKSTQDTLSYSKAVSDYLKNFKYKGKAMTIMGVKYEWNKEQKP